MICFLPVRGPEVRELEDEYERFLSEFSNLSRSEELLKLVDYRGEACFSKLNIEVIYSNKTQKNEDSRIKEIRLKHKSWKTEWVENFLRIEVIYEDHRNEDDEFAEITWNFILPKLIFIINLTYATKVDFLPGLILSNEGTYLGKSKLILSSLDDVHEYSMKIEWPNLHGLKLDQVIEWYNEFNLHPDDLSKNKLHRAMNAFSHSFSALHEKDTSVLFWAMLGIEALLAEGSNNIINQIKVKASIILGEPKQFKNKLDKLYNYRSRFVHGDINFPAKFSSNYDNFKGEYWDYLSFANSILIALIRHLIEQKKDKFTFEYKLID